MISQKFRVNFTYLREFQERIEELSFVNKGDVRIS